MRSLRRTILYFVVISVPLFLFWEYWLKDAYLGFLAETFAASARAFGQDVYLMDNIDGKLSFRYGRYGTAAWSNEFGMTAINLVPLVSLVLSTSTVPWMRRLRMLVVGLVLLLLAHVIGLWTEIWSFNVQSQEIHHAVARSVRALLTGFGTFMFPILIWLFLIRDQILRQALPQLSRKP